MSDSKVLRDRDPRGQNDDIRKAAAAPPTDDPEHGSAAPVHPRRAARSARTRRRDHHQGASPDIGFLHTGIEKQCEAKNYQQVVPLTDRVDYLANLSNNLCYVLAVEKLLGMEIPPQAQWMRVMLTELQRINSHLVWLGTHALDIGAMTVFFYCFRERENILRIFEMFSGQRMMTSYFRIGGLALEPPRGWEKVVGKFIDGFPENVDQYEEPAEQQPDLDPPHPGRRLRSAGDLLDWASPAP